MRAQFNSKRNSGYYGDLKTAKCANCLEQADEFHHIIPLGLGGTNHKTNIVPLCFVCHGKAHASLNNKIRGEMVKIGQRRAREQGKKIGKPRKKFSDLDQRVIECFDNKLTVTMTSEKTGFTTGTISRWLNIYCEEKGIPRHNEVWKRNNNGRD